MREWWNSGCAGALTVRTWLLALPAGLGFGAIFTLSRSEAPGLIGVLLVLSGYVAAGVLVYLVRPLITRQAIPTRSWLTLGAFLVIGPITAAVARLASSMAGFPPQGAPPASVVAIAIVCALWLTAAAMISFWIDRDADMRRRLLRELARERALAIDSSRYLDYDRQQLTESIEATVRDRLESLGSDDASAVAPALEDVIATVIRPLSRQLHDERVEEDSLVQQMQDLQVPRPRRLREYVTSSRTRHGSDLAVIAGMAGTSVISLLPALRSGNNTAPVLASFAFTFICALALGWVLIGARARAESVRTDLTTALQSAEWASARLRQSAWVARRQLANSLHGNVQARVLASALRLRDEPQANTDHELRQLDEGLSSLLRGKEAESNWHLAWDRLTHIWNFSIELHADLPPDVTDALDADPVAGQSLVAVIGEAVTNAVRHGDARVISISVEHHQEDELLLTVNDDGPVGGAPSDPGLGTAVFEAACIEWSVTPTDTGHQFTARIPISSRIEKTEADLAAV